MVRVTFEQKIGIDFCCRSQMREDDPFEFIFDLLLLLLFDEAHTYLGR